MSLVTHLHVKMADNVTKVLQQLMNAHVQLVMRVRTENSLQTDIETKIDRLVVVYAYRCFLGVNCEVDIDDCATYHCENGGTCVDLVNDYICQCPPTHKGLRKLNFLFIFLI